MKRHVDYGLSALFIGLTVVEVLVRDFPSRPFALAFGVAIALTVSFRRAYPLGATIFAFGLASVTTLVSLSLGLPELGPYAAAALLLMPYTLARWGTRRDVIIGGSFMVFTWLVSLANGEMAGPADAIGGAVVMFFPGALGAVVRFRDQAHERAVEQARLLEREQLARELHDSVAHHMMAITLQAQAARAVIGTRPDDAKTALAAIEDESKRTLAELRDIVGALRDDADAALTPAGHIADLPGLATRPGGPKVEVELHGDLSRLSPAVERAVYRLAQESITNAAKHAHNATRVHLRIAADDQSIHLTARDDGAASGMQRQPGYGLVGMAERAALLGGTFAAGPHEGGGWLVDVTLPRTTGER